MDFIKSKRPHEFSQHLNSSLLIKEESEVEILHFLSYKNNNSFILISFNIYLIYFILTKVNNIS